MTEIEIREINTKSAEYEQLLHFRNRLLRVPLGLNLFEEDNSSDAKDYIIIAMQGTEIVGCVMLQPQSNEVLKLRQMATAENWQGKGLGKILVADAEEKAKENNFRKIELHARLTAQRFYEKMGYTPLGSIFTEVTIPHIAMQKTLQ